MPYFKIVDSRAFAGQSGVDVIFNPANGHCFVSVTPILTYKGVVPKFDEDATAHQTIASASILERNLQGFSRHCHAIASGSSMPEGICDEEESHNSKQSALRDLRAIKGLGHDIPDSVFRIVEHVADHPRVKAWQDEAGIVTVTFK